MAVVGVPDARLSSHCFESRTFIYFFFSLSLGTWHYFCLGNFIPDKYFLPNLCMKQLASWDLECVCEVGWGGLEVVIEVGMREGLGIEVEVQ